MSKRLHLSPDVSLPLDAVTQTFAILGVRGSGKTVTASVMTEQMIAAGLPVVVVDPIGVWWGLRHSRDGKGPGLSVVILGGEHADVPLEETGGAVIADFVVEHRVPAVLDLGGFSKSAHRRFMVDFAERLYRVNREALHVVLDEADTLCPQRVDHGGERLVGAINDIVRRGRARGLGATLISQRPALISKDVLTQVEALVVHRMTGPQDRDAVERWVEHNADRKQAETVLASLQSLGNGEAWLWSPAWLGLFKRTQIDMRTTFDSSATPKAGQSIVRPKNPADVDLGALKDRLSATIEKAKAEDPRELRRRIAELEKQLKAAPRVAPPAPAPKVVKVEVPVLTKAQEAKLDRWATLSEDVSAAQRELAAAIRARVIPAIAAVDAAAPRPAVAPAPPPAYVPPRPRPPSSDGESTLDGPMRKILAVLAQLGPMDKKKLALLSGYTHDGGGFNNPIGRLRSAGYMTPKRVEPLAITSEGVAALGAYDRLPEDAATLFSYWMAQPVVDGAMRSILTALREAGGSLDREELASRCVRPDGGIGYEPTGGGFNNPLGRLRRIGLVSKTGQPTLAPELQ